MIQCTKKLLDEIKVKPELNNENESIFSWHGNIIPLNRRKTVVLVNDKNYRYNFKSMTYDGNKFCKQKDIIDKKE